MSIYTCDGVGKAPVKFDRGEEGRGHEAPRFAIAMNMERLVTIVVRTSS